MSTAEISKQEIFGHPKGLFILFFTEMWERFSYYGMRVLLVLYMTANTIGDDPRGPGLGWSHGDALALYGWYTMLVYVMSIPGGMIADKILGQKRSVLYGAIILCLGHGVLAFEGITAYYSGLALVILGVGLLKPNISTMVGGLYSKRDIRRDKGFSIFYIGINMGSLLATTIIGFVVEWYGWHAGFGLAGIAMVFGLLVYVWGLKFLKDVGEKPIKSENSDEPSVLDLFKRLFTHQKQLIYTLLIGAVFAGFWFYFKMNIGYALLFLFITAISGMLIMIYKDLTSNIDRDRFIVLLLSFIMVIIFWGAFEQAGGLMNLYTDTKTDRVLLGYEIPTEMFQSLNAGFIILLATSIAGFWAKRKLKSKEASSLFKMAIGIIIMGLGFVFMVFAAREFASNGSSSMVWLVLAYLFHTTGELCLSPVALSFITKLAPVKYASLMMGVYFAASGLGNKVAGVIGEQSENFGELQIFSGITIFTVIIGLLFILILKPLKRLTHGAEEKEGTNFEETEGFELADNQ